MAKKLLFIPGASKEIEFVDHLEFNIEWLSPVIYGKEGNLQNVRSLHSKCSDLCNVSVDQILEVSGASLVGLGRDLSAMNLGIKDNKHTGMYRKNKVCVESLYQGSKVFEKGGPHHEIYTYYGFAAKKKIREKHLGKVIGFDYYGTEYPIDPKDSFYNWLYNTVLCDESNRELMDRIMNEFDYFGFTDIFFNHDRQVACQAKALAKFIGMSKANYTMNQITDFETYRGQNGKAH